MPVAITPITRADIPGAAECIQLAFEGDPYNEWVFDKAKFNKARNLASLTLRCEWGIRNAAFFVAKDAASDQPGQVLGIAMWTPPSPASSSDTRWSTWLPDIEAWRLWFNQGLVNLRYGGRGGLRVKRYYIWKSHQAEAQRELWTDPRGYWFCNIVVVRPGHQGEGVGRMLMEEAMRRADQEGVKCYLESSRQVPNVRVYERMGFKVVRDMTCEDDDEGSGEPRACDLFCMVRDPRAVGDTQAPDR